MNLCRDLFCAVVVTALALPAVALAQAPAAKGGKSDASSKPDASSTTYQDWTINCTAQPEAAAKPVDAKAGDAKAAAAKPSQLCEMVQQFVDRNSRQVVARIAIGRTLASNDMKVVIQAPAGILLPPGVAISDGDKLNVKAPFTRCVGTFCNAEIDGKPELLNQMKSSEKLTLSFPDGAGQMITLPISTRGLSTALAALTAPNL